MKTPETDEEARTDDWDCENYWEGLKWWQDFSRKQEREKNQARAQRDELLGVLGELAEGAQMLSDALLNCDDGALPSEILRYDRIGSAYAAIAKVKGETP